MATFNFERVVLSRPLGRWDSEAIAEGREEMVRYTDRAEEAEPAVADGPLAEYRQLSDSCIWLQSWVSKDVAKQS